jgi:hypothetical protein
MAPMKVRESADFSDPAGCRKAAARETLVNVESWKIGAPEVYVDHQPGT